MPGFPDSRNSEEISRHLLKIELSNCPDFRAELFDGFPVALIFSQCLWTITGSCQVGTPTAISHVKVRMSESRVEVSEKKKQSSSNTIVDELFELDWILAFQRIFGFLWSMVAELYRGITRGTMPIVPCLGVGIAAYFVIGFHWDYLLLERLGIEWLYPAALWNSTKYRIAMMFIGFVDWAFYRAVFKIGERNRAKHVFESAGLKSRTGQTPMLLAKEYVGNGTERMRISRAGLSKQEFEKAKGNMESSMGVFFNSIEEDRVRGTVDITYSKTPIPEDVELAFSDIDLLRPNEFFIGAGHTGLKKVSLSDCPHLLVAGETGSGKSTFLQQFITCLYRRNPQLGLTLIDLKGGLEFASLNSLPGISVVTDREEANRRLSDFPEMIGKRVHLLRSLGARSVEDLSSLKVMLRHVVIVDEAAEMFLSPEDNAAKSILSQIARQGRALGIHLVMATQRPDTRALDPQIKANLTGVLCFKMLNDASSITVLGNGRATELPAIPGRALWKLGPQLTEVQAPYLHDEWSKELLEAGAELRAGDPPKTGEAQSTNASADRFKPIQ